MGKRILGGTLVLVLTGLLAAACGGGGGEEGTPTQSPGATAEPQATPGAALEVSQVDFRFQPTDLAAQAAKEVKVDVANDGQVSHTFTITELNVDKTLRPGEKTTVTFTPGKSGTFAFYCKFHRSRGMEGTLEVSGGSGGAAPGGPTSSPIEGTPSGYYGY